MADMKKIIPRDDSGSRHSAKMTHEVIEQDFSSQQTAISNINAYLAALSQRVVFLETRYNPFAEYVFIADDANSGSEEALGREVYISNYTQFRIVIGQEGANGADYDLQYYDGGWVDAQAATFTTGGTDAVCYHSDWEDIPAGMAAFDIALLRIHVTNDVAGTLTTFMSVQFWDGSRGAPPESGGPLP